MKKTSKIIFHEASFHAKNAQNRIKVRVNESLNQKNKVFISVKSYGLIAILFLILVFPNLEKSVENNLIKSRVLKIDKIPQNQVIAGIKKENLVSVNRDNANHVSGLLDDSSKISLDNGFDENFEDEFFDDEVLAEL